MTAPRPPLRVLEGGSRPRLMGLALELVALGAGLTLTVALLGRLPAWFHDLGSFQALFAAAFGFYALALALRGRYAALPHAGWVVFGVALAARMALLPTPPSLSGDVNRYIWEGSVVAHGGNPYRHAPLDPAWAPLRDRTIYPNINHKELSAIYPPLGIAGFALVARIAPTVPAFKLWVMLHDLALVWVLLLWSRRRGEGALPVIAYAWNPLVLVEYAGSAHSDPTAMVWLIVALAYAESRPVLSALSLALGALVKLAPLLALPLLFARWPWRARLACLAVLVPGLAWYVAETRGTYSGLVAYWGTWRNNELLFHYLERWTGSFGAARSITFAVVGAALAFAAWKGWSSARATRLGTQAALLATPVLHPWYLGWELMLEPLRPSAPWLLLSMTVILNYGVLQTPSAGRSFHLPVAWRWVEYGVPLALALVLAVRSVLARRRAHVTGGA